MLLCKFRSIYEQVDRNWDYYDSNKDNKITLEEYTNSTFGEVQGE